ncbi:hypothetical protein [Kitasatospora sp. NPDC002040]|uniref:hypothetical protein n=1 Tax=Kitasatospora sp. NPDC002040 TaxID=3154661 RepID=UPI00333027DB
MSDLEHTPSPFVAGLPIGAELPLPPVAEWDIFPFEGDLRVRPLDRPVLPEPPRHGEDGPENCDQCNRADQEFLWTDEHWRLTGLREPSGLPAVVLLMPRGHHDLADLPAGRAAELGPMLQRVERALHALGGIARVHVDKLGDGAAHLHLWFSARPEGMLQLRGSYLSTWDDILPPIPVADWQANGRVIAAAMAAEGGTAHV